jgi:DNA mismatch repair protein MutL
MGRIRILPDQVANQIAAGEVVERPASVVKELLENSLDAGATDLRVEVEAGGRRLIRIVDDGCGMLRDDALLAFERHATSKLRNVKDLLSIATLGFRGEALPSIASVSRLLLETRSMEEETGTRIEIAGGKMLRCEEAALGGGTVITVRDLFHNVPARRKFLRTEQTELAHIASLVTHYSLAHPDKSFRLSTGSHRVARRDPCGEHEGARLSGFRKPGAGRTRRDRCARAGSLYAAAQCAAHRRQLRNTAVPSPRTRPSAVFASTASSRDPRCRRPIAIRSTSSSTGG